MFIYVFDEKLRNELIKDQHKFISEGCNEKGHFWIFEIQGAFDFSTYSENKYLFSKKLFF